MTNELEVNGIKLTGDSQDVLRRWLTPGTSSCPSDPERFVEYINNTQDCLIHLMLERSNEIPEIADLLTKLISIKDDIKMFIPPRKEMAYPNMNRSTDCNQTLKDQ